MTLPDLQRVYERGVQLAVDHLASQRDWRADDLQETAAIALRAGADRRARGLAANPWLGSRYSEQRADQWLRAKATAVDSCRTGLAFTDEQCGLGVVLPTSCHVRGCPRCERARATRLLERFELPARGCPPDCHELAHVAPGGRHLERMRAPKLLTLTMPNVARHELREGGRQLRAGFRRMRQRALFRGGKCRTRGWSARHADWLAEHGRTSCLQQPAGSRVRCSRRGEHRRCGRYRHEPVKGGVYAIETTYNDATDTWNVHMHVLLEGPFLPHAELVDTWRACMLNRGEQCRRCGQLAAGCACPFVIDIQPVHCKRCKLPATRCRCPGDQGLLGALREVLKYVGKPTDDPDAADPEHRGGAAVLDAADPDRYCELVLSWYGQRLVSGFGAWAILPSSEQPIDRESLTFVRHPVDPYAGWYLPRACPWCARDAHWSNQPRIVSRLEAVRTRQRAGPAPGRPPPLLWHESPGWLGAPDYTTRGVVLS